MTTRYISLILAHLKRRAPDKNLAGYSRWCAWLPTHLVSLVLSVAPAARHLQFGSEKQLDESVGSATVLELMAVASDVENLTSELLADSRIINRRRDDVTNH